MITRIALTISSLALLAAAPPNSSPRGVVPAQRAQAGQTDLVHIALETEKGRILVALDRGRAPLSTANFLRYVEAKRFDGITFYRAMPYGAGNGLIQAGILRDARLLFPAVAHEPASKTGLKHEAGTILLANAGPGTAKSDFFITLGPIPFGDDRLKLMFVCAHPAIAADVQAPLMLQTVLGLDAARIAARASFASNHSLRRMRWAANCACLRCSSRRPPRSNASRSS